MLYVIKLPSFNYYGFSVLFMKIRVQYIQYTCTVYCSKLALYQYIYILYTIQYI